MVYASHRVGWQTLITFLVRFHTYKGGGKIGFINIYIYIYIYIYRIELCVIECVYMSELLVCIHVECLHALEP